MSIFCSDNITAEKSEKEKSYEEGHRKGAMKRCRNDHRRRIDAFFRCSIRRLLKNRMIPEIRIAALKGPTGMGMVKLADKQNYPNYTVSIEASPDALNPRIISSRSRCCDRSRNRPSGIYNKLDGDISVLAVSTLGVLYVVEAGSEVNSVADLAGKTVYATDRCNSRIHP